MIQIPLEKLRTICNTVPRRLLAIEDDMFSRKPAPGRWSSKEILGHLIDSATINHHRFVRGQFEATPRIGYDQDAWNEYGHYQRMDRRQLVGFWELYNRQLISLAEILPESALMRTVDTGAAEPVTITFLVHDYLAHLEHHLKQIFSPR